jgi:hypothetical protein
MSSPAQTVRLDDLADVCAAVPHLLGFHPTESIVVVGVMGERGRIEFTLRLDLPDPDDEAALAEVCAQRMAHAGAEAVIVFVYTSDPVGGGDLPRRSLVDAVVAAVDVPLRDAALVAGDRVWSYICADARCCPPEGRAMRPDSAGATALAAAHALNGDVVLPDRDAVVATTAAVGGITATSMRQALARASLERWPADDEFIDESLAFVDRLTRAYADGPVQLTHDDAARFALMLCDIELRDELIVRLADGDDELSRLITDVARLAQPPYDAPAATLLAVTAYFRGHGVVAVAAAERALATNASYSLARLLLDALERQVHPQHVRRIWRQHRR